MTEFNKIDLKKLAEKPNTLVFATNNLNKAREIKQATENQFEIFTLGEIGLEVDIPEPFHTLHENASAKSFWLNEKFHINCFSEDSGLEVEALNGAPGVLSARYAGPEKNEEKNIQLLLKNLKGINNRKAQFRTVISLLWNQTEYFFEGICKGMITEEIRGQQGFGYDPVFIPDGASRTFGEMNLEEKAIFSHRKKAVAQLVEFLKSLS
jgi:XTP/dITP diphosphohydrolase